MGVSVGIQESKIKMFKQIEGYVNEGYHRIKVKIKPGWDVHILKSIRAQFSDIKLMSDANCAYTLNDISHLNRMVEQPLDHVDSIYHAKLQSYLNTPTCLDESIHTFEDA